MAESCVPKQTSWSNLPISKKLILSLKENGFEKPLPIQLRAIKAALVANKHILGAARTGSGKTLAYLIPVLNRILTNTDDSCSLLKKRICENQRQKEDFELIDNGAVSIEDMIVERIDSVEDEVATSDCDNEETLCTDDSEEHPCPEAIVLVPTRELALQVKNELDKVCVKLNINSCCLIGGLNQDKQVRILKKKRPQVIIATPGRLHDIAQSGVVDYLNFQSIASIRTLVIDEADRMVQKGHFEEMTKILNILEESKKFRDDSFSYRVYVFSATLTFLHELPDRLRNNVDPVRDSKPNSKKKKKIIVDPKGHSKRNKIKKLLTLLGISRFDTKVIDINDEFSFGRPCSEQLAEYKINCVQQEKDLYLYYFLRQNKKKRILIFCNSKDCLRRLANVLKYLRIPTLTLHADMDQKKRMLSLEKFRKRSDCVLVATDVAARGLDIVDLDCVVHYQVPRTCESYIHRSGRTARLFKKGISLTLCEPKEAPNYRRLCSNINGGKDLDDYEINLEVKLILKDLICLAQQCDKLDHHLRESKSNRNWFVKAAKDCDIELEEDDFRRIGGRGRSQDQNNEDDAKNRRRLAILQKRLNSLLKKPIISRRTSMKQTLQTFNQDDPVACSINKT